MVAPEDSSSSNATSHAGPEPSQLEARGSSRTTTQAGKEPAQPHPTPPPTTTTTSEVKRGDQVGPTRFEEEDGFGAA
ncbi:hypothetical protein RHOSPDRAFT_31748 [Rhodotorula sp. JG-1b]|nr:hypothetical protein RHOSPDRAFT_31748 [Rhodotorula sp. JG-1b]